MRVGLIGYGKIGKALEESVLAGGDEVAFILDPFVDDSPNKPIVRTLGDTLPQGVDLVCECANRAALAENFDVVIASADLLCFSLTAFSDDAFLRHAQEKARETGHTVFVPHGAILGLDGIFDGRSIITDVSITTTKSPKSLGLDPAEVTSRQVMFDGSTRDACSAFPRNVNVHAAVALAGIGFDRTRSTIIADPAVSTNAHVIHIAGEGIDFTLNVSSFASGGVSGAYTPLSAVGSLRRVLGSRQGLAFV